MSTWAVLWATRGFIRRVAQSALKPDTITLERTRLRAGRKLGHTVLASAIIGSGLVMNLYEEPFCAFRSNWIEFYAF